MINIYANSLDVLFRKASWRKHKHDINIFWGEKNLFLKRNKQRQRFICLKNCEMNNFLTILELCVFYIKYKKIKPTAINFRGRTSVKYFMQTQLLRFCKDTAKVSSFPMLKITAKSTHFLPLKKEMPILKIEFQKRKCKMYQNLTSKHRAVKNLQTATTFSKNVNKEARWFFKK